MPTFHSNRCFRTLCLLAFMCLGAGEAFAQGCEQVLPTLQVCHSRADYYRAVEAAGMPKNGLETFESFPVAAYPHGITIGTDGGIGLDTFCSPARIVNTNDGHGLVAETAPNCFFTVGPGAPQQAIGFDVTSEPLVPGQTLSPTMSISINGYYNTTIPLPGWQFIGFVSTKPFGGVTVFTPSSGGLGLVDNVEYPNGPASSQANPHPPVECSQPNAGRNCFVVDGGPGWYDPATSNAYKFDTDGIARFTAINDFPVGFSDAFIVSTGGTQLGQFGPGQSVQFPNGGVTSFIISGITPAVDGTDPFAFPIKLTVDTVGAIFSMEAFSVTDSTPPVVTANLSGVPGTAGWYVGPVGLTWTTDDAESGIQSTTGCDPLTVSADTTGVTRVCTATNGIGAATSTSVTIRVDQTAPQINALRAPAPNANNWSNAATTITFQCADGTSGLAAGSPPAPTIVSTQGAGQTVTGACADVAGNTASLTVGDINIDTTAPVVTAPAAQVVPQSTAGGAIVTYPSPAIVDGLSGVAASSCAPQSGSTFPVGTTTVTCSATDRAGNTGSASFTVTVTPVVTTLEGRMLGLGFINRSGTHHHVAFRATRQRDQSSGRFEYWTNDPARCGFDDDIEGLLAAIIDVIFGRRHCNIQSFIATSVDAVTFSDDPASQPGGSASLADTVSFGGVGLWNGRAGFRFEVVATDRGEPGRNRDTMSLVIRDASGATVATVNGTLSGGNIQTIRP